MHCVKFKICLLISLSVLSVLSGVTKCDDSMEHGSSSAPTKKTRCATEPNASKKVEKVIKECENELKIRLIRDTFLILDEEKLNPHHDDHDEHESFHHDHEYESYHYDHQHGEDEPAKQDDDRKKINLHIVHEPKPTHDYYNHHDNHHPATPSPSYEPTNKYWPYPEQPSPTYGHQELNKKYWPHRSKRSPYHHHHIDDDDDDETWKYNYELNENIHSATILPEDRWIAGCLIHCVLEKNNATDKHGWPTLDGLVAFYTDGVHEHEYFLHTLRFVDHCLKGASHRHGVHRYMEPKKGQNCELSFDVFDCVTDKITEYCAHK